MLLLLTAYNKLIVVATVSYYNVAIVAAVAAVGPAMT